MLSVPVKQQGLSLIELMIAIVIAGILTTMGISGYSNWTQNQQTRVAAEAILNGIQIARSEAVKRNGFARIVLCGIPDSSWEILAAAAAAPQPSASLACAATTAVAGEERIQERSAQEGSTAANVTVTPNGATTITFNGVGRVINNQDGSVPVTQVDITNPSGNRPLRITISTGGSVRMCDPSIDPATGDPRKC